MKIDILRLIGQLALQCYEDNPYSNKENYPNGQCGNITEYFVERFLPNYGIKLSSSTIKRGNWYDNGIFKSSHAWFEFNELVIDFTIHQEMFKEEGHNKMYIGPKIPFYDRFK